MYKTISDQLITNVLKKANEVSLKERHNFNAFGEILEEYIQNHQLIVGENTGIDLIVGRPFNINSYPYIIYSKEAENDGFNIADELYSKSKYKYIQAISQLDGAEIQVKIGDRQLAKIIQLEEYKGIDMLSLTDPKVYPGWFNKNLLCISVDVQLASIYRQLSSPAFVDKWETLLDSEYELFEILKDKIKNNKPTIKGGNDKELNSHYDSINQIIFMDDTDKDGKIDEYNIITSGANENEIFGSYDNINDDIHNFIIELGGVIIKKSNNKLQITNINFEELENLLKKKYGDQNIQKIIQLPKIPGDERLRRYTYYLIDKDKRKPIIDLFNIDKYDPIPQKDNYVHPLVKIRMLIVDIWTIKLVAELGNIDKKFAEMKVNDMYNEFIKLRTDLSSTTLNIEILDVLKNGYTYIGVMDKDQYSKSKIIRKNRDKSEIYTPSFNK